MTFREKLQQEHPECINKTLLGGCRGCPCDYQYENARACDRHALCEMCWDREIPDNEQTPKFGEWISVKERLPEFFEAVLGFMPERISDNIEIIYYTKTHRWRSEENEDCFFGTPSHWMPLPEAPEVEE